MSLEDLENYAEHGNPYSIWTLDRFKDWTAPKDTGILENAHGEVLVDDGADVAIVGPPGVGKSRLAMQLAIAQITNLPWAGLSTRWPSRRWLVIGNENSIRRQAMDLKAMTSELTETGLNLVRDNLFVHVQDNEDDHNISVNNAGKWEMTLNEVQPDVILVDPFEALLEHGDGNDAGEVRRAMSTLKGLLKASNPKGIIIYVHHARTGVQAARGGMGMDRNNYAKGSKTFTGIIRAQFNVLPASPDNPGAIALDCGKLNDARPFPTTGLNLNQQTMSYEVDEEFDPETLAAILEGKEPPITVSLPEIKGIIEGGENRYKDIVKAVKGLTGASEPHVRSRLQEGVRKGLWSTAMGIYSVI